MTVDCSDARDNIRHALCVTAARVTEVLHAIAGVAAESEVHRGRGSLGVHVEFPRADTDISR